jgi:hypothetical protein
MVFLALALVFGAGSAGQIQPAQAAPAAESYGITLHIFPEQILGAICVGSRRDVFVSILSKPVSDAGFPEQAGDEPYVIPPPPNDGKITGVNIEVTMAGDVGTVSPTSRETGYKNDVLDSAHFVFTAEKAGIGTLEFKAVVPTKTKKWGIFNVDTKVNVEGELNIIVEDCKYSVTTITTWTVTPPGATFHYIAILNQAEINLSERAGASVPAKVDWFAAAYVKGCSSVAELGQSDVDVTGSRDDFGGLAHFNLIFYPVILREVTSCPPYSMSPVSNITPEALEFVVPSGSGGTLNTLQVASSSKISLPGAALVVVSPLSSQ